MVPVPVRRKVRGAWLMHEQQLSIVEQPIFLLGFRV